jgi:hypothetical protein
VRDGITCQPIMPATITTAITPTKRRRTGLPVVLSLSSLTKVSSSLSAAEMTSDCNVLVGGMMWSTSLERRRDPEMATIDFRVNSGYPAERH